MQQINVGDRVRHATHGTGTVYIAGQTISLVLFDRVKGRGPKGARACQNKDCTPCDRKEN